MNETYKIAIVDDSKEDRNYIEALLNTWSKDNGCDISIKDFESAESFLFNYSEEKDFDILLLDIEMGDMDGVSMAKEIRKGNETVQIIFITGYSDYIADGYDVAALNYLIKPVNNEKLLGVLNKATSKIVKNEKKLILKTTEGMVVMPIREIKYLEVQQNYVTVHGKTDVTVKKTLGEFEKELDERFFRLGRSYIVNLSFIRKVTKNDAILTDDTKIPLPRGYYDEINKAIIKRI